jgi:hypothetical protein
MMATEKEDCGNYGEGRTEYEGPATKKLVTKRLGEFHILAARGMHRGGLA